MPLLNPLEKGGAKYKFYGPGERPFRCYRAFSSETLVSREPEAVKILLKKFNPILRNSFLAVTIVDATEDRVQFRIKVGEDLVTPLAEKKNTVFYGMGTLVLTPLFGETGPEEDMEVGDVH